jgi:hypothetical protein
MKNSVIKIFRFFDSSSFDHSLNEIDEKSGYIYILESLSSDEKISTIKNLYKIGYSTIPVKDRIKNAINEPTYLMAPVRIVSVYEKIPNEVCRLQIYNHPSLSVERELKEEYLKE